MLCDLERTAEMVEGEMEKEKTAQVTGRLKIGSRELTRPDWVSNEADEIPILKLRLASSITAKQHHQYNNIASTYVQFLLTSRRF